MKKEMIYRSMVRPLGNDTLDTWELDRQDALQDVAIEFLSKEQANYSLLKKMVHDRLCNMHRKLEARFDLTEENREVEIQNAKGEVVLCNEEIRRLLDTDQLEALRLYAQGHTLKEVATMLGYEHDMEVLRILRKAWSKIEILKISYLFESKYATYAPKRSRCRNWPAYKEANGTMQRRQYRCLDQDANPVPRVKNRDGNFVFTYDKPARDLAPWEYVER